jgi:Protein of unknown function (DUF2934)
VETKTLVKNSGSDTLPLEERIRLRAHELYIDRGNESGSELDDWLQAEDEIAEEQQEYVERD